LLALPSNAFSLVQCLLSRVHRSSTRRQHARTDVPLALLEMHRASFDMHHLSFEMHRVSFDMHHLLFEMPRELAHTQLPLSTLQRHVIVMHRMICGVRRVPSRRQCVSTDRHRSPTTVPDALFGLLCPVPALHSRSRDSAVHVLSRAACL
jgi:hypothetical protein